MCPDIGRVVGEGDSVDALLFVGPPRRAPRTLLDGPVLNDASGRAIPVAWLPCVGTHDHRRFAATAARVQTRARAKPPSLAVLGQWHPRYLKLADRVEDTLQGSVRTFRWTGERIGREDLVAALGCGLGLALYLGHGRPSGWVGYWGLRARHFAQFDGEPLGALLSLCCLTASRRRVRLSFCEALPLLGVSASCFAAVTPTLHTDNTRWVVRLCSALAASAVHTVGDLVARALVPEAEARAAYRIIGDPFAPLSASIGALKRAAAVATYP